MTTIATDGKSMAGDGLECEGNTITGRSVVKVERLPDGRIVGVSGRFTDAIAFRRWLTEGGAKPKVGEMGALVLCPDGTVLWYDKALEPLPSEIPAAVGCGMDHALTAMDAGCAPERAVELAALRDPRTGGNISVLYLEPDPRIRAQGMTATEILGDLEVRQLALSGGLSACQ